MQGLRVVKALGEAEATLAALQQAGLVDLCATKDGDCLLFGADNVLGVVKLQACFPKPQ